MKIARRTAQAEVPSMAMGDIAFNLLIFFVILARAQDDSHLQWQAAKAAEVTSGGGSKVSVVIDRENKLYLNGQEIGQSALAGRIEELLTANAAGDRQVLVKVHHEALGQRWGPVLEAIGGAGGEAFLVLEKENATE